MVRALLGHERFLREAMVLLMLRAQIDSSVVMKPGPQSNVSGPWIPTPYFPIVQAEQNGCSIALSKCIELIAIHCIHAVPKFVMYNRSWYVDVIPRNDFIINLSVFQGDNTKF